MKKPESEPSQNTSSTMLNKGNIGRPEQNDMKSKLIFIHLEVGSTQGSTPIVNFVTTTVPKPQFLTNKRVYKVY
jgi:hypothetical protein